MNLGDLSEIEETPARKLDEIVVESKVPGISSVDVRSSPDLIRENTRTLVTASLLFILSLSVVSVLVIVPRWKTDFISKYPEGDSEKAAKVIDNILDKDTINLIWTSQVTLLGTVLGFYFGAQSNFESNSKSNSRDDD